MFTAQAPRDAPAARGPNFTRRNGPAQNSQIQTIAR
jgi:hypothetical protein